MLSLETKDIKNIGELTSLDDDKSRVLLLPDTLTQYIFPIVDHDHREQSEEAKLIGLSLPKKSAMLGIPVWGEGLNAENITLAFANIYRHLKSNKHKKLIIPYLDEFPLFCHSTFGLTNELIKLVISEIDQLFMFMHGYKTEESLSNIYQQALNSTTGKDRKIDQNSPHIIFQKEFIDELIGKLKLKKSDVVQLVKKGLNAYDIGLIYGVTDRELESLRNIGCDLNSPQRLKQCDLWPINIIRQRQAKDKPVKIADDIIYSIVNNKADIFHAWFSRQAISTVDEKLKLLDELLLELQNRQYIMLECQWVDNGKSSRNVNDTGLVAGKKLASYKIDGQTLAHLRVKGDGNCLFYSCLEAIKIVYAKQPEHPIHRIHDQGQLRQAIVDYYQKNWEDMADMHPNNFIAPLFREFMLLDEYTGMPSSLYKRLRYYGYQMRIAEFMQDDEVLEKVEKNIEEFLADTEQLVDLYCHIVRSNHSWGSQAELELIGHVYDVQFIIHNMNDNGRKLTIALPSYAVNDNKSHTVHLVFSRIDSEHDYNHWSILLTSQQAINGKFSSPKAKRTSVAKDDSKVLVETSSTKIEIGLAEDTKEQCHPFPKLNFQGRRNLAAKIYEVIATNDEDWSNIPKILHPKVKEAADIYAQKILFGKILAEVITKRFIAEYLKENCSARAICPV